MARVLGLDLGSRSVKAVVFETAMRGYQTLAFNQVRRPEGAPLESLRAALEQLLADGSLAADQVVISLPGPALATHALTLPFTDPKRLEATIPFEIESQLPFDLSEAVYDYQVVTQREKQSDLLIGVVRKAELASLLELLQQLRLDPRVVTHPGVAYQNLFLSAAECFPEVESGPGASAVAIVDIGHERTSVAIGRLGGGLELARTFSGGGKDLSRALALELQIPIEEANHFKETRASVGSTARGADAERASAALTRGLQPILRELRPTLKSYSSRSRIPVGYLYLCGGSSKLAGLDGQLSSDLGIPARLLSLPSESAELIPPESQAVAAQAYALALRGQAVGARPPRFNLRRGPFAFKGDFDYLREKVGVLAAFAAALLVLMVTTGLVRNSVLSRREAQVDAMLCETTQRVLGTCEKNFDRALNMLKGKESPAAVLPKMSAVGLLSELVQRMPTDIPLTVDQITVDLDRIAVRCQTDSSKQVDKITAALKTHKCFKEVKEGKVEKTKDGKAVTFRLDVQVECPEAAPQG